MNGVVGHEPSADRRRRLAPMRERIGDISIRRIAVDQGHARLVLDGPRPIRKALEQRRLEPLFDRFFKAGWIEIDDIDIVRRCGFSIAMQMVLDTVSNEARRDPPIRQPKLAHRRQGFDHGMIGPDQVDQQVLPSLRHGRILTNDPHPVQAISPCRDDGSIAPVNTPLTPRR